MSDAKNELDQRRLLTIAKMKDWENQTAWCRGQISEILRTKKPAPVSEVEGILNEMEQRLFATSTAIHRSSDDLDQLDNFFKFQRSNLETRKYAFDSWPESRYVERMLWVATVLISLGGGAFATGMAITAGDIGVSLITPAVFWGIGLGLLVIYLSKLKAIDNAKMNFYRREFGLERDLPEATQKVQKNERGA